MCKVSVWQWMGTSYKLVSKRSFYPGNHKYAISHMRRHPFYLSGVVTCLLGESSVHFFKFNPEKIKGSEHFLLAHKLRFAVDYRILSKDRTLVQCRHAIQLIDSGELSTLWTLEVQSMESSILMPPYFNIETHPYVIIKTG